MRKTHFAFTSNSSLWGPTTGVDAAPFAPANDAIIFLSYSLEKGSRFHLQGYIVYRTARSLKAVKKDLPAGAHIEVMIAKVGANDVYCGKLKPGETHIRGPWTFGDPNAVPENPAIKQKAFDDLIRLTKEGKTKKEIYEAHPFLLGRKQAVEEAAAHFSPPTITSRPVKVYLVYGEPHSGKTEACQHAYPDHFLVCGGNTLASFYGYRGQQTLIFDAFKPNEWPITVLEQLIKPPVVDINIKYGCIKTLWTTVIITTNCHPDSLYCGDVSRDSLFRRVYKIINVPYLEEIPAAIKILDFN